MLAENTENHKIFGKKSKVVFFVTLAIILILVFIILNSGYIIGCMVDFKLTKDFAISMGKKLSINLTGKGLIKSRKGKNWQGIREILISKGEEAVPYIVSYGFFSNDNTTKRNALWFQRLYLPPKRLNGYFETVKDALIEIMKNDKNEINLDSAHANFRILGVECLHDLVSILHKLSRINATYVIKAILLFDEDANLVIADLIPLLNNNKWYIRKGVCKIIGNIGVKVKKIMPRIIPLLKDESFEVRTEACHTIGVIGFQDPEIVNKLKYVLENDRNQKVRIYASGSLARNGIIDKKVIFETMDAIQKDNEELLYAGLKSLKGFPPEIIENNLPKLREVYSIVAKKNINVQVEFLDIFEKINSHEKND